jgi:chromosome segregation ATPase
MSDVASANINTFGPSPKAGFESPSEQLIVLSYGQLQDLIKGAIEQAIQPLQDEVSALREGIDQDHQEIAALRLKMASLETLQEQDTNRICLDIAYDRRRLSKLENAKEEPTDTEKERVERIEKLCTDASNHEISLSELRGRLGIDKAVLSRLLKRIDRDKFYLRKSALDKRIRYLCLRPGAR